MMPSVVHRVGSALLAGVSLALLAVISGAMLSVISDNPIPLGPIVPDAAAYHFHATVGDALNSLKIAPLRAVTQWERAASHARSSFDIEKAASGIKASRAESTDTWIIDDQLCSTFVSASQTVRTAINSAGLTCSDEPSLFGHVEEGSPITYRSRPPIGGVHYATWYPRYGVVEEPVLPGYWVHNLEHGAVVLLYKCPDACPDLLAQLRGLYDNIPRGQNQRHSAPRLLITPYSDQDNLLAIVAWGHKLELNSLDTPRLMDFYDRFVDRGPECRNFSCPD